MTKGFVRVALLTTLLVGGCSTVGRIVRQEGATRTEETLAAAGFQIEPADTADRLAELHATAPFKIVVKRRDGKEVYAYADPVRCRCLYVGDAQQYAEYQRLQDEDLIAAEDQQALAVGQYDETHVGSRGPFASPWWWR